MTEPQQKQPKDFGPFQALDHIGLSAGEWARAVKLGAIPEADSGGRWSRAVVEDVAGRLEEIRATLAANPQPVGATKTAAALAERTRLDVWPSDVYTLAEAGHLRPADEFKGHDLYAPQDAAALPVEIITKVVETRQVWRAASLKPREAAARLGWTVTELEEHGRLTPGQHGRYARADVETLASNERLDRYVTGRRTVGPEEAAALLEIRPTDFKYVVAAGWVRPVGADLYRVREVRDVLDLPGVDWEAVRAVRPGEKSPLREYAQLPPERPQLVSAILEEIAETFAVPAAAWYHEDPATWLIQWDATGDRATPPTRAQVRALITSNPVWSPHAQAIELRARIDRQSHESRSTAPTDLERQCPCPKARCGAVRKRVEECPEHAEAARKTMRNRHTPETCPAVKRRATPPSWRS